MEKKQPIPLCLGGHLVSKLSFRDFSSRSCMRLSAVRGRGVQKNSFPPSFCVYFKSSLNVRDRSIFSQAFSRALDNFQMPSEGIGGKGLCVGMACYFYKLVKLVLLQKNITFLHERHYWAVHLLFRESISVM